MIKAPQYHTFEKMLLQVQHLPALQQFNQPDISLSMPMFSQDESQALIFNFFHYPAAIVRGHTLLIGQPFSRVKVVYPELEIQQIEIGENLFAPLIGTFPVEQPINENDVPVTAYKMAAWYDCYETCLNWYPSKPAGLIGSRFLQLFTELVHPALIPFYQIIGPDFIRWLEGEAPA